MRYFNILLLIICAFNISIAQSEDDYGPILEDGKVWILNQISEWDADATPYHYAEISIKGDTIVNGVEAKVVRYHKLIDSNNPDHEVILYEKDKMLYFYDWIYLNDWSPLIDFNFKEGEKTVNTIWDGTWKDGFVFDERGTILCQAKSRGYVRIQEDMVQTYWIEGIGSPSLRYLTVFPSSLGGIHSFLGAVYLNEECLFEMKDMALLSGISNLPSVPDRTSIIYDLHGREVSSPVPGSIYIRDGKKFVAE